MRAQFCLEVIVDVLRSGLESIESGDIGQLLLLTDHLCPPECTGRLAACAAGSYNASGLLISTSFAEPPPSPPSPL